MLGDLFFGIADVPQRFEAVQFGHLDIEQYRVHFVSFELIQRNPPVRGSCDNLEC